MYIQAWDIHFLTATVEEGNKAANYFWAPLQDLNPLMAPCEMFNWDYKCLVVLEVTNTNVYLEMQTQEVLDWVYLVAPGLAVVAVRGGTESLKDLEDFTDTCVTYNSKWGKTKANQGAYFAERIVLSKALLKLPELVAKQGDSNNRVYWDRNAAKASSALLEDSKAFPVLTSHEVVVTLNNWHFMGNRELTKKNLETIITPYLITQCKAKGVVADLNFTWHQTPQATTWKLNTHNDEAAKIICTCIIDVQVTQQDQMANLNFKSNLHKLGQGDLQQYFGNLAIKNVQDEYGSHDLPSYEADMAARWEAGTGTGSWLPIDAASSSAGV